MRLHKKLIFCFSALLGIMVAGNVVGEETETHHTSSSSCQSLTATGNSEYPPFLWRESDSNNHLVGANRLIIDELSRHIGIPIKLMHVGPWSRAQSEVKSGRVDIMAGAFYTNSRADYMDYFSPVMLHTTSVVWQRKDNMFPFHRKEDLEQKWGVTVINNSFGQTFDNYAQSHLNILSVASLSQAFKMLVADRVDYVLYEKNPGVAYATMLGFSDVIQPVQPPVSSEGLYLTMSKNSPCNSIALKQKIAMALQEMKQEGFNEKALLQGLNDWETYRLSQSGTK